MHAFVILKLIQIDPKKNWIYLTETEFYALLIILVANLIMLKITEKFFFQQMKSDFN